MHLHSCPIWRTKSAPPRSTWLRGRARAVTLTCELSNSCVSGKPQADRGVTTCSCLVAQAAPDVCFTVECLECMLADVRPQIERYIECHGEGVCTLSFTHGTRLVSGPGSAPVRFRSRFRPGAPRPRHSPAWTRAHVRLCATQNPASVRERGPRTPEGEPDVHPSTYRNRSSVYLAGAHVK